MKGALKAVKRTPFLVTSKVGMATKSQDPEINELVRKFSGLEEVTGKLLKDAVAFKDVVTGSFILHHLPSLPQRPTSLPFHDRP